MQSQQHCVTPYLSQTCQSAGTIDFSTNHHVYVSCDMCVYIYIYYMHVYVCEKYTFTYNLWCIHMLECFFGQLFTYIQLRNNCCLHAGEPKVCGHLCGLPILPGPCHNLQGEALQRFQETIERSIPGSLCG